MADDLEDKVEKEGVGCAGLAFILGCGVVGAFLGNAFGYVTGNLVEYIPLVKQVGPRIADYVGFQPSANMNEDFYQLTFGVLGLYLGMKYIPQMIIRRMISE